MGPKEFNPGPIFPIAEAAAPIADSKSTPMNVKAIDDIAKDDIKNKKNPSDTEIRDWLEGNICRCTGYQNIVAAVKEAASKM